MQYRIKEIRESKAMKAAELARAAKISHPFLYDLERGARTASNETLERIADALGVTVQELKDTEKGA